MTKDESTICGLVEKIASLKAERDRFREWASCGGVPIGRKCRVDGHEIYGPFLSDEKGDICECHMMQESMRQLDLTQAKCAEMARVLSKARHRLLVMVEEDEEDALYADEIKAIDDVLKGNPGHTLLDRLELAEAKCAEMADFIDGHAIDQDHSCIECGNVFGQHDEDCKLVAVLKGNPGHTLLDRLELAEAKCVEYGNALLLADQLAHLLGQCGKSDSPYQAWEDMYPQIQAARQDYGLKRRQSEGNPGQALLDRMKKAIQDAEYQKSAADAATKIMHQTDAAWKADKDRLAKLERVRDAADEFTITGSPRERQALDKALAAFPKEGK